jgi:hypothetical protein
MAHTQHMRRTWVRSSTFASCNLTAVAPAISTDRVPLKAVYGTTCCAAALSCKDTQVYVALDPHMHVCSLQWLDAGLVLLRAKASQTQ